MSSPPFQTGSEGGRSPAALPRETESAPPVPVTVVSTPRSRAALLIVLLVAAVLLALTPFLSGLLGAAVLYVIAVRPYRWLAARMPAGLAASIALVAALLLIAAPLAVIVVRLIDQAPDALQAVLASPFFTSLGELRIGTIAVGSELTQASGAIISWASARVFNFVGSAASATVNLVIAFFGLYYLLRASSGKWAAIREYIPFSARTADALRDRFVGVTEATILGSGVVIVTQGVLIGGAFAVLGLPDPLFWGTVATLAAILPVVGSALVWLPAAVILLLQHRYGAAITLAIVGGVIAGNTDQVIRPRVYRRVSNLHPMITLVGAFAGIRYFGLVGLLLGPLAIAYVFELLHFYRQEYGTVA